jgi:nucleotide-binding universal stress UspA family protein
MNTEPVQNRLTVKANTERGLPPEKIVVALDLSARCEGTAHYAAGIAKSFGASLFLVHVHQPIQMNEFITEEGLRVQEHDEQVMRDALTKLTNELRETYPACNERFIIGTPAEGVASAALELGADLIITASRNPSFLSHLLGLHQAPKIVRRAPCPVLVYHDKTVA